MSQQQQQTRVKVDSNKFLILAEKRLNAIWKECEVLGRNWTTYAKQNRNPILVFKKYINRHTFIMETDDILGLAVRQLMDSRYNYNEKSQPTFSHGSESQRKAKKWSVNFSGGMGTHITQGINLLVNNKGPKMKLGGKVKKIFEKIVKWTIKYQSLIMPQVTKKIFFPLVTRFLGRTVYEEMALALVEAGQLDHLAHGRLLVYYSTTLTTYKGEVTVKTARRDRPKKVTVGDNDILILDVDEKTKVVNEIAIVSIKGRRKNVNFIDDARLFSNAFQHLTRPKPLMNVIFDYKVLKEQEKEEDSKRDEEDLSLAFYPPFLEDIIPKLGPWIINLKQNINNKLRRNNQDPAFQLGSGKENENTKNKVLFCDDEIPIAEISMDHLWRNLDDIIKKHIKKENIGNFGI